MSVGSVFNVMLECINAGIPDVGIVEIVLADTEVLAGISVRFMQGSLLEMSMNIDFMAQIRICLPVEIAVKEATCFCFV